MLCCGEDLRRVVDADDLVTRRMEDEKRLSQGADVLRRIVMLEILQELSADREGPAADVHVRFTGGDDLFLAAHEEVLDVLWIIRRADDCDGARFVDVMCSGEHCSPAEAVPDQELRRPMMLAQVARGRQQIAYVRGEVRL